MIRTLDNQLVTVTNDVADNIALDTVLSSIAIKVINAIQQCAVACQIVDIAENGSCYRLTIATNNKEEDSTIDNMISELERALGKDRVRYIPPCQDKFVVSIEIAKPAQTSYTMAELCGGIKTQGRCIPLGIDSQGSVLRTHMDNALIYGVGGTGKTMLLHQIVLELMQNMPPSQVQFLIFAEHASEWQWLNNSPYMLHSEIIDATQDGGMQILESVQQEIDKRAELIVSKGGSSYLEYNERLAVKDKIPVIYIIIDECAPLWRRHTREMEDKVLRMLMCNRYSGVKLIISTKHSDNNMIVNTINKCMVQKVLFKTRTAKDSEWLLGRAGAEKLQSVGDALVSDNGCVERIQTPKIGSDEPKNILENCTK